MNIESKSKAWNIIITKIGIPFSRRSFDDSTLILLSMDLTLLHESCRIVAPYQAPGYGGLYYWNLPTSLKYSKDSAQQHPFIFWVFWVQYYYYFIKFTMCADFRWVLLRSGPRRSVCCCIQWGRCNHSKLLRSFLSLSSVAYNNLTIPSQSWSRRQKAKAFIIHQNGCSDSN